MKHFLLLCSFLLVTPLISGCGSGDGVIVPGPDSPPPSGAMGLSPEEMAKIEAAQAAAGGNPDL